ncbi:DnaJ domain-containing protein [Sphingomonas canadensis]|uniref:DnaJ domain-containing protein n=1 Tax=Sphingomonas canadensis TaxID=1219257 RepID=A0ABW3GZY0_9SPHN|nr:DnaJ domain-containing protein [Sphingomonas canadensis]MCW3835371.1 DnaJ domain-containing protein [Sphingomonas canadensis]
MSKLVLAALLIAALWLLLRKTAPRPPMPEAEARAVLGVGERADEEAIRAAHRRLVTAVHPDRGGSEELTRRINAARDVLLGKLR